MKLFIGLLLAMTTHAAFAHRVDLVFMVEGDALVFFASTGADEPVVDGEIEILSDEGVLLANGLTDNKGLFRWTPEKPLSVTVEVYAGLGHKQSIDISEQQMREILSGQRGAPDTESLLEGSETQATNTDQNAGAARVFRRDDSQALRAVLGITCILALGACWLSYRNFIRIRALEQKIHHDQSRD
jgi:hypothetical protein